MSELNYIGAGELVFENNKEEGIHSGGFSVNSIMLKAGMSPIRTLNYGMEDQLGGTGQVSDLFNNLVVPNWALSYNNRIVGGKPYKEVDHDDDSDDDVLNDDLHEKLLELVKEHNVMVNKKKRLTKKNKPNQMKQKRQTKKTRK